MEEGYGIIEPEEPKYPIRKLLVVPHIEGKLTVGYPAFGPDTYKRNLENMGETYSHPITGEKISFRPATTSESISPAAYDFKHLAKPTIFDSRWLQTGYIVRTQDGVFTNTTETNEKNLEQLLDRAEKVNGIYLISDKVAFAPYETFESGIQDCDTFAQGGLARALEHTSEKIAKNLREIASPKHYKKGVDVWGFDSVKEPVLRVASLDSYGGIVGNRLNVFGVNWYDDDGCAFGVLENR